MDPRTQTDSDKTQDIYVCQKLLSIHPMLLLIIILAVDTNSF